MNWNQPICVTCWYARHPYRLPVQVIGWRPEQCAYCGVLTSDGIFVRAHPASVPFPAADDEQ